MKYLVIILLLLSCTPEQRLSRLLKRYPRLKNDTLNINDTIITKSSHTDSTFVFNGDTVRIYNDRQEIKYYYNTTNNKSYISSTVKPDTIVKELKVPYERIEVKELEWYEKPYITIVLILLLFLFFIFKNR